MMRLLPQSRAFRALASLSAQSYMLSWGKVRAGDEFFSSIIWKIFGDSNSSIGESHRTPKGFCSFTLSNNDTTTSVANLRSSGEEKVMGMVMGICFITASGYYRAKLLLLLLLLRFFIDIRCEKWC